MAYGLRASPCLHVQVLEHWRTRKPEQHLISELLSTPARIVWTYDEFKFSLLQSFKKSSCVHCQPILLIWVIIVQEQAEWPCKTEHTCIKSSRQTARGVLDIDACRSIGGPAFNLHQHSPVKRNIRCTGSTLILRQSNGSPRVRPLSEGPEGVENSEVRDEYRYRLSSMNSEPVESHPLAFVEACTLFLLLADSCSLMGLARALEHRTTKSWPLKSLVCRAILARGLLPAVSAPSCSLRMRTTPPSRNLFAI